MNITFTDIASFQLALIGIMVSVLTLLFALVVGKRDELRTLKNFNDAVANSRKFSLENSIDTLSKVCRKIVLIIALLFLLYLSTMVLNEVLCEESRCLIKVIDAVTVVGIMVWVIVESIIVWKKINKD